MGTKRQFSRQWMDAQKKIAGLMRIDGPATKGATAYWRYLAATALAEPKQKYDSVRLVAPRG